MNDISKNVKSAAIRAIWTFFETFTAMASVGSFALDTDLKDAFIVSFSSACIAFIKSVGVGSPENALPSTTGNDGTFKIEHNEEDEVGQICITITKDLTEIEGKNEITLKVEK